MRALLAASLLTLTVALAACGGGNTSTTTTTDTTTTTGSDAMTSPSTDASPAAGGDVAVVKMDFLDSNKQKVTTGTIKPSDRTIYFVLHLNHPKAGVKVDFALDTKEGASVGKISGTGGASDDVLTGHFTNPKDWAPGTYEMTASLDGNKVEEQEFTVSP